MTMVNAHRYGCGTRILRRDHVEQRFFEGVRAELLSESMPRWAELEIAKSVAQPPTADGRKLRAEHDQVVAEVGRVVDAICKVGISTALETRLKALEERQRQLAAEVRAAETTIALPNRAEIAAKGRELATG
jgi:hypothetical protein